MVEGLHAAIIALLGVVGGLVQLLRRDMRRLEEKLDRLRDERES